MKKFNLFKMLAVLIVLITCSPQLLAWSVWGGKTIYIDNSISEWSSIKMKFNNSSWEPGFTQIGSTSFWYCSFANDFNDYDNIVYFKADDWSKRTEQQKYNIHPSSFAVIVPKGPGTDVAVGYFTDTRKATPDTRLYFDATPIADWGSKAYLRYGFDCVAHADPMTKFPGTASLFYIDVQEAYYDEYTVANNAGYTKSNRVWQPTSECKPTGDYEITRSLNYSKTNIDGGESGVLTFVPSTPKENSSQGCDWFGYTKTSNTSIPTQTVKIGASALSHGAVRVSYYNTSGSSTTTDLRAANASITVPQSAIIQVTAVPDAGYYCTGITVGGSGYTAGDDYTVTATTTIAATFDYRWSIAGGNESTPDDMGDWNINANIIANIGRNASSKDTGYVYIDLPANTNFEFLIKDKGDDVWYKNGNQDSDPVYYMTYTSHTNWDFGTSKKHNCGIATAAAGKYKFAWNITDKTLTVYYPTSYKVTYNANGGSGTPPTDDDYYGASETVTVKGRGTLSKSGYDALAKWNSNVNGSGTDYAISSGTFSISANTTLYAKWTQSITLNANGGASNTTATAIWNHAGPFAPAATQTYSDHTLVDYRTSDGVTVLTTAGAFAGTNVSDGSSVAYITSGKWAHAAATTLYAHWKVNTPTISCTDNVITMTVPTGSTVYYTYTTDGSDPATPTSTSNAYDPGNKPTISQNTKFKAIAIQDGCDDSDVSATYSATYTPVYTVEHTLSNVTKSSGETSVLENKAYTAVYEDATGYDLPTTVSVTVGGNSLALTTDYTWNQGTGTLNILANKITGNVVITINGVAETYDGTLKNAAGISIGTYTATYGDETIAINDPAPTNAGYDIGGFYLDYDAEFDPPYLNQLASAARKLAKSTDYTDGDGKWTYTSSAPDLIVKWIPHKYTVYLDQEGGSGGSDYFKVEMNTADYEFGDGKDETMALPSKTGYDFAGYYTAASSGTQIFDEDGNAINNTSTYVGANAKWIHTTDYITLHAQWTAKKYTITLNDRGATTASSTSTTLKATYDSDALTASITAPRKWGNVFGGWVANSDGTGTVIIGTNGKLVEDKVDGYIDEDGKWIRDNGNLTLYAKWTVDDDKTYTLTNGTTPTTFVKVDDGIYRATRTMAKDNTVYLYDGTTAAGPTGGSNYEFSSATGSSSLGTNSDKFKYTGTSDQTVVCKLNLNNLTLSIGHVVFYLGDKDDDDHKDVTDYDGYHADLASGISGTFEYRLRVNSCTEWSTLYLPFSPTDVTVWGGTTNHHLFPYYYSDKLYQGYYVLRTPTTTDLEIEKFDQWFDPSTYNALPNANTPYIVQWRNSYLYHKYISIWGSGMTAPSFGAGTKPATEGIARICGNGSLTSRDVTGAYVLESDYGGGAWLRPEDPDAPSSVGPFQCYILTAKNTALNHRVLRHTTGENTATGWEDVVNSENKAQVVVYTITGLRVTEYNDCSFDEAGRRLSETYNEGIFIMRAGDESVKLMLR